MIRPATLDDADAIWRLNVESLGYDFPLDDTIKRLESIFSRPANRILVCEPGGEVVGYIHIADYDCSYVGPLKDVLALAVLPEAQGQGVGRKLLEAAEAMARADGCAGIRLNSGFGRDGAHRFYEACGYHNRKDQKNFIKIFE